MGIYWRRCLNIYIWFLLLVWCLEFGTFRFNYLKMYYIDLGISVTYYNQIDRQIDSRRSGASSRKGASKNSFNTGLEIISKRWPYSRLTLRNSPLAKKLFIFFSLSHRTRFHPQFSRIKLLSCFQYF